MPILLDASFIIAFDNERDVHHNKTLPIWIKIANGEYGQYFISDYIFDEISGVSLRKIGKEKTINLCNKIIRDIPIINIDQHIFDEAWIIFEKTKLNLSFTDCTNLVLLKLMSSKKIATFDKGFNDIKDVELINN